MKYTVNVIASDRVEGICVSSPRDCSLHMLWMKDAGKEGDRKFNVTFKVYDRSNTGCLVTGRDYGKYPKDLRSHIDSLVRQNKRFQYVEVGSGLGGFAPYVSQYSFIHGGPKPIIIDPINYRAFADVIKYAMDLDIGAISNDQNLSVSLNDRLKTFLERCNYLTDTQRVRHVRSTLEGALRKDRSLIGVGDVLVDIFGAWHYSKNKDRTALVERALCKNNTAIFTR